MLRAVLALFSALAIVWASTLSTVSAQEPRDPLIDPPSGGAGSRFQIVGQSGWTPAEPVTLIVGFTTSTDPLDVSASDLAPVSEFTVTVLADGTWSFPIVVDELFAASGGAPDTPGYIVVRASSPSNQATNTYVYTVRSVLPAGSEAIVSAGFGPGTARVGVGVMMALFGGGTGALLVLGGTMRRRII